MVKDTQNSLNYLIISFSKKNTLKLLQKLGTPCKRKPLHGTLAFEWISFSRDVRFYDQKTCFTLIDFHCNLK